MKTKTVFTTATKRVAAAAAFVAFLAGAASALPPLTAKEALGKALFNDPNLSSPVGQSCVSCHSPSAGFTFPISAVNQNLGVAPGAVNGRFGFRAVPQVSYSKFNPPGPPFYNVVIELYSGGQFWDGRAVDLTDQVHFPIINPNEMNNIDNAGQGDLASVVDRISTGASAQAFKDIYGQDIFTQPTATVFANIADAIAEYEKSVEVSPFSSKYDAWKMGKVELTDSELNGLRLTTGTWTGRPDGSPFPRVSHCGDCHMVPSISSSGPDVWTATCYQNIGVPRNTGNPYYSMIEADINPYGYNPQGADFIDYGQGKAFYESLGLPAGNVGPGSDGNGDFMGFNGDFKAPSLRNVDLRPSKDFVKAYMHNGVFKSLEQVVHFYNTRNLTTEPGEVIDFTQDHPYANLVGTPLWNPPEYPSIDTLVNPDGQDGNAPFYGPGENPAVVGNLTLTAEEEADIVAFLKTLSDGYFDPYDGWTCATIVTQPVSQPTALGSFCAFSAASNATGTISYQWRKNGVPIDGEHHSFIQFLSPAIGDDADYDCVMTTECGVLTTRAAHLTVCAADFNNDGFIDFFDFNDYVNAFEIGDPSADVDGDGFIDFFDFNAFVISFENGCAPYL